MTLTIAEIAARLGVGCAGDVQRPISGLAGIREAQAGDITFLANARYEADAAATTASAILVGLQWDKPTGAAVPLRVADPDKAFAQVSEWFAPPPVVVPRGVHPTAVVAADVQLGQDVCIGPGCVVEAGARIGDRTVLVAQCYVGAQARIGADCRLYPLVSLRERVELGQRVIVHNGAVLGSDGFGYTVDARGVRTKIPQIGTVVVGDDVEIGANVTIDRARFGRTRIGNGVKIDNLVQIAHNVVIGDHAVVVAQVGISGSTEIGPYAILAGQSGVAGHLKVGAAAVVAGRAGVTKDVPPKTMVFGFPAAPASEAKRTLAMVQRLPELRAKVAALEQRCAALEAALKAARP